MSDTFVESVLAGDSLWTEIDDWVDRWHQVTGGEELHEFLGLSWPEYKLWVEQPSALRVILGARERGKTVEDLVREPDEFAFAARSLSETQRDAVLRWLRRTGRLQN
jgi:hypothetical protein